MDFIGYLGKGIGLEPGNKLHAGKIASNQLSIVGRYKVYIFGTITAKYKEAKGSPAESVVELYETYGDTFQRHLEGQFLIIIADDKSVRFFNDRYSYKNCYYYHGGGYFVFAGSLKLLLKHLPFEPEFDLDCVPSFLATGFSFTEKTQFKDICRMPPASTLIYDTKLRFADHLDDEFRFDVRPVEDLDERLNEYETVFQESIRNSIIAAKAKRVGCFLSGGQDTAFALIQASKVFLKPIHTFTARFAGSGFDEVPKAQEISGRFRGIHHVITIDPKSLDVLPDMIRILEEPISGSSFVFYICAKEAAKHADLVITGDGGDTLWNEYYPVAEWHRYLRHMPSAGRKLLHQVSRMSLWLSDWERLWELEHTLSLFTPKDYYSDFFQRLCTYRHFNERLLRSLLRDDYELYRPKKKLHMNADNFYLQLIIQKMFYGVYPYLVPISQKVIEHYGMAYAAPYLNRKVMDFITSLPAEWVNSGTRWQKIFNDAEKRRFHKEALLRYLPKRFVYSMQRSFDVPWTVLLNRRPGLLAWLLKRLKARGWYNNEVLDRIFSEFAVMKAKPHELCQLKLHGYRIYSLLSLEIWCMQFLDKKEIRLDDL
ncbi:MAG: asparagine synthase-related protein [archaeon]